MMIGVRKTVAAATVVGSMLVGGVTGAILYGTTTIGAAAATTATTPTPTPAANTKFVPNEDPAHEATESAAREAQENAGIRPTVP
jgi:hypothetical protein